jgi:hypothetical protein
LRSRFRWELSGDAPGLLLGIGYSLTPAFAIDGEFVATGTVSAPQRFQYTWVRDYTATSRDLLFNALVRWKAGRTRSLQFVGGAGLARSAFGRGEVTATYPLFPVPPGRPPERYPGWSVTSHALALSGGVDLDLRVHPRISIVPTFRTRWIGRTSTQPAIYLGVGRVTYHFGIGVRLGG